MRSFLNIIASIATTIRRRNVHVWVAAYCTPTGLSWVLLDKIADVVPATYQPKLFWWWLAGLVSVAWFAFHFDYDSKLRRFRPYPVPRVARPVLRWAARVAVPVVGLAMLTPVFFAAPLAISVAFASTTPAVAPLGTFATESMGRALGQDHRVAVFFDQGQRSPGMESDEPAVNLRGVISEVGESIIVSVRLEQSSGQLLWSSPRYTLPRGEEVQLLSKLDSIASLVVDSISPRFQPRYRRLPLIEKYTRSSKAFVDYTNGLRRLENESADDLFAARDLFAAAAGTDPDFVAALAGLADVNIVLWDRGLLDAEDACRLAKVASDSAFSLDRKHPDALTARGIYKLRCEWRLDQAQRYLRGAVAHDRANARAHRWYGVTLAYRGSFSKALDELRTARDQQPASLAIRLTIAKVQLLRGDYSASLKELGQLLHMEVDSESEDVRVDAKRTQALAYAWMGRRDDAVDVLDDLRTERGSGAASAAFQAQMYALLKDSAAARAALVQLNECYYESTYPAYVLAYHHAVLGEDDLAYRWLRIGADKREYGIMAVSVDPAFSRLRENPKYRRVLKNPMRLKADPDRPALRGPTGECNTGVLGRRVPADTLPLSADDPPE